MSQIPSISINDVQSSHDRGRFDRGDRYYRQGRIFNTRREGMSIKAQCHGSRPDPYAVTATFDESGVANVDCTCPDGAGGYGCKHVIALLLTWLDRPDEFREIEGIDSTLERLDKAELIVLIKEMLRRQPDLELLLEAPLPGISSIEYSHDPGYYRGLVATAFGGADSSYGYGYDYWDAWGIETGITSNLTPIVEAADALCEAGEYRNAGVIYQIVVDGVIDHGEISMSGEGELFGLAGQCIERLADCFERETDLGRREELLDWFWETYAGPYGGYGIADSVPWVLVEMTTLEERVMVAGWVRDAMPERDIWSQRTLAQLLLGLQADTFDDEAFLDFCQEYDLTDHRIDRLLQLGRIDDAVAVAEQRSDWELIRYANLIVEAGHPEVAERLVKDRLSPTTDHRLRDWLKDRYVARGEYERAQPLAVSNFVENQTLHNYVIVRELAIKTGEWDALRSELIAQTSDKAELTMIYIDDGEIDAALETLDEILNEPGYSTRPATGWGNAIELRVARAIEESRPEPSIELYQFHAERLILGRQRSYYHQAAEILSHARTLADDTGASERWEDYILDLRARNRRLPAFQDELNQAGL